MSDVPDPTSLPEGRGIPAEAGQQPVCSTPWSVTVVPAPGPVVVGLETTGVPGGTTVNVTVKPRVGGVPHVERATLTACGTNGVCTASVLVDLTTGAYVIEARATFQLPWPHD